jgi:hypothetical protein
LVLFVAILSAVLTVFCAEGVAQDVSRKVSLSEFIVKSAEKIDVFLPEIWTGIATDGRVNIWYMSARGGRTVYPCDLTYDKYVPLHEFKERVGLASDIITRYEDKVGKEFIARSSCWYAETSIQELKDKLQADELMTIYEYLMFLYDYGETSGVGTYDGNSSSVPKTLGGVATELLKSRYNHDDVPIGGDTVRKKQE